MGIQIDLRQAIYALSDALDLVGVDETQHGKRVGFMALECGRALGAPGHELDFLFHAGLLHDCGVSSTEMHRFLVAKFQWHGAELHCRVGHQLLKEFPPLAELAPVILYHHTPWKLLQKFDLPERTARQANLIFLTDRVDALSAPHYGKDLLLARPSIIERIRACSGDQFAPELVETFIETARSEAFWLSLEPRHLALFLRDMERDHRPAYLPVAELRGLALLFARIVDAKSSYTWEHSTGVARLTRRIAEWRGMAEERCDLLEIAGLLHDLGKLQVPDEVLDKPGPLNDQERCQITRHSFETYQILRRIPGFEEIALWAAYHHEAPDGRGYPFHVRDCELGDEARIIAVADVFQALAQRRPYREPLGLEQILPILRKMAEEHHLDRALVEIVERNQEESWRLAVGVQ